METLKRYSPAQAAKAASRAPITIYRALESGDLHGAQRKARGAWWIRQDCLDAWLDGEQCEHQLAATRPVSHLRLA
ncbi:hypothetical protein V5R04_15485 [Jonesiaceae bacterium BS-20]|uniref:Helix-turn-helix domain-containing protein n=1 Tax=Jonesiaceae bacterium BS-20 TaxID=3120821 RepID=A0AAU7DX50_9MICO